LEDDKLLRLTPGNKPIDDARNIINLFGGASFQPTKRFYLLCMLGPSFINGNTYLGIEPSLGFYFSDKQKIKLQFSYTNIFNREFNYEETKKEDFGSIGLSIGFKLF
jgi:hypothetical protein